VAGVKNHPLKSLSTPQQLFAQLIFVDYNPFSGQVNSFKSPTSSAKLNPAALSQSKALKTLAGHASKSAHFRGTLATTLG